MGGLGGRDVSKADIRNMFLKLQRVAAGEAYKTVDFFNLNVETNE